jgi:hypothetical protein
LRADKEGTLMLRDYEGYEGCLVKDIVRYCIKILFNENICNFNDDCNVPIETPPNVSDTNCFARVQMRLMKRIRHIAYCSVNRVVNFLK